MSAEPPVLVACGHGTRDPAGRAALAALVGELAAALPDVEVREAYVDVHGPVVGEVVAAVPRRGPGVHSGVVVPLLLAAGYHVRVDLAEAVRRRPDVVVAPALGPDDRLVDVLVDRVGAPRPGDAVVLAPAGSSDDRAQADSQEVARRLAERLDAPVRLGYAAGPTPSVAEAVAAARADGAARVVVASYLLAPGFFQDRLGAAGADHVTGPLLPDPRVVEVVLDRYRAAAGE
ncbi:sirohydrochlorin chelatase [Phycicoccus sonneratiae]|uniref:Sirohydrochlorin chelatase n=1 Tax=Phycicoccus sonneratiae TaxID=2807628 RepID=A0ABS2CGI0_9MICO|nr:CbiX/SirB N-terminal domain-containing protein [Phycicoccus sonneraticus]MBM6398987.1 sirohydrochlorin chelatase [Phycicoccus sonneraticus]